MIRSLREAYRAARRQISKVTHVLMICQIIFLKIYIIEHLKHNILFIANCLSIFIGYYYNVFFGSVRSG